MTFIEPTMSVMEELTELLKALERQPDLSPQHISLIVTVYACWAEEGYPQELSIAPSTLMQRSRVSRRLSFYTYIRDLEACQSWKYSPAKNQNSKAVFDLTNSVIFQQARYKTIQARRKRRVNQNDTSKTSGLLLNGTGGKTRRRKSRSLKTESYIEKPAEILSAEGNATTHTRVREEEENLKIYYSSKPDRDRQECRGMEEKGGAGEKTEKPFSETEFSVFMTFQECFRPLYPTADLKWYFQFFQTWKHANQLTRSHNWYATICTILNRHLANHTLKLETYEHPTRRSERTSKAIEPGSTGFGTW